MGYQFAFILPTTHCDSHCEFCFYETGHSSRVEAVDFLEPLGPALGDLVQDGLQQIIISGGEPLLAPRFWPLVEVCSTASAGRGVQVLLLTRGQLLDELSLLRLDRQGVDDITISATTLDDRLRETVQRVMFHSRFTPTLLTCLTRANLSEVPRLLDFSQRLNLPHLFTPVFVPEHAECYERLSLRHVEDGEWSRALGALGGWARLTHSAFYLKMVRDFFLGLPVHPGFCPMGTGGLVVDADGSVYPCFHRHDLKAGNLLVDPWPELRDRLEESGPALIGAPCFGEHCLSMFAGIQE